MSNSPWVVEVDEGSFDNAVMQRSNELPVVVDFWAEWCAPCKMLAPLLESFAEECAGKFLLAKVNTDHCPNLAAAFQVQGIPYVVAIVDGKLVNSFTGVVSKPQLATFLDQICPSDSERLVKEAGELELTDAEQAQQKYAAALQLDPKNTRAMAALADLFLTKNNLEQARSFVDQVGEGTDGWARAENVRAKLSFQEVAAKAGSIEACEAKVAAEPENLDARRELGMALAANGNWERALDVLIECVERNPSYGAKNVKEIVVKIFSIIGAHSELANKNRSRLASALY